MKRKLKRTYKLIRNYYNDHKETRKYQVRCYNTLIYNTNTYTSEKYTPNHWLYRFLVDRMNISNMTSNKISIFGVNGDRGAITLNRDKHKIFYTAENVHDKGSHWEQYEDLFLSDDRINLSLGFDFIEHEKYVRFPFWIMAVFDPTDSYQQIKQKCDILSFPLIINREKFCAFICRKDYFGDRTFFYNQVSDIGKIYCPSTFMHNDDSLADVFGNNKIEYLKTFKFNLCPENTFHKGHVTEKIFDSIKAGCIPIYWGADGEPEKALLNQNAFIYLDNYTSEKNGIALNEIEYLNNNYSAYKEFASQQRLVDNAAEIINQFYIKLETKIIEMI